MGKFRYDTGETITFDSEREDRVRQDRGSQLEAILGRSLSDQETLVSNTFWTRVMEMSRDLQKPENCKDTLLLA